MCKTFVERYKSVSDNELICMIRENDQDAFEALFYRYLPLLKHIISKNNASNAS
jgi:DNA-directed RNA polymerase specialized sigma subunit